MPKIKTRLKNKRRKISEKRGLNQGSNLFDTSVGDDAFYASLNPHMKKSYDELLESYAKFQIQKEDFKKFTIKCKNQILSIVIQNDLFGQNLIFVYDRRNTVVCEIVSETMPSVEEIKERVFMAMIKPKRAKRPQSNSQDQDRADLFNPSLLGGYYAA
ncbi:hypothetical protein BKH41_01835 [Helicobacter sp. 12S02232-10]|uniref:hypothetical protein n=1 Tax=Helicobacter sp. 12S02232-10 TaxID=1476197 RepID=UPI000BA58243|nr:hypothetical protein [Helicobacter sp. 12S02232-10]PAF49432.1 hypothetical protein BKH41_01835 [Helicobacter sp. 12S02232-10]